MTNAQHKRAIALPALPMIKRGVYISADMVERYLRQTILRILIEAKPFATALEKLAAGTQAGSLFLYRAKPKSFTFASDFPTPARILLRCRSEFHLDDGAVCVNVMRL